MGLYLTAWLFRVVRTIYNSPAGCHAKLSILPDNMLKIEIHVPARVKWAPGQHVFLRFFGPGVGIHFFSSHPFTIASLSSGLEVSNEGEYGVKRNRLVVISKVHGGVTRSLAQLARKGDGTVKAFVDGPYGGLPVGLELMEFDGVLLLAGGTGKNSSTPSSNNLIAR